MLFPHHKTNSITRTRDLIARAIATEEPVVANASSETKNFDSATIIDVDGKVTTGFVKQNTAKFIKLQTVVGKLISAIFCRRPVMLLLF
jgi:hypothetical protein